MAAKKVWHNATILYHGVDLSPEANSFAFPLNAESLDSTNFASAGWMEVEAGRNSSSVSIGGMLNDAVAEPRTKLADTAAPVIGAIETRTAVAGDVATFFTGLKTGLTYPSRVNQLQEFDVSLNVDGVMGWGVVLDNLANITATGDGTGFQAGAIASGDTARFLLAVSTFAGTVPTLDVTIESDATDAWVGAETTRATFTQVTTDGTTTAEIVTLAGPVTDTWWRVAYTIGGTVTDADFIVLMATS